MATAQPPIGPHRKLTPEQQKDAEALFCVLLDAREAGKRFVLLTLGARIQVGTVNRPIDISLGGATMTTSN